MAGKWTDCMVSITCKDGLGVYQGLVSGVNPETQTILLSKGFRNGVPCNDPKVVLSAHIIEDIKILESTKEKSKPPSSTVAVSKPVAKRAQRPVSENITHINPGPSLHNPLSTSKPPANKAILKSESPRKTTNETDFFQSALFLNNKKFPRHKWSEKDEACFGESIKHHQYSEEFDFEKNLALFDKQTVTKRGQRQVSENNSHAKSSPSLNNVPAPSKPAFKPLPKSESPRKALNDSDTFQSALFLNTNKKNPRHKWTEKDEACFGEPIKHHQYMKEFDFEKNLALFNKQAVFQEINAQQRPDLVRQTDRPLRAQRPEETVPQFRQIQVPQPGPKEYITDEGMIIPSITSSLRDQLFLFAQDADFTFVRLAETVGRAVVEVAIPLLGGPLRLNPLSDQQKPFVVALVGSHKAGALAVNTMRQLASHGVETVVFLSHPGFYDENVNNELNLYRQTGHRITDSINELPTTGVDLVIVALADERTRPPRQVIMWASEVKATLFAVDPPANGTSGVLVHYSLVPCLPLAHSPDNGKLFLANIAIPHKVFAQLSIRYRSPFGPKFVIPLHPKE